jgi:hypothetical protein
VHLALQRQKLDRIQARIGIWHLHAPNFQNSSHPLPLSENKRTAKTW